MTHETEPISIPLDPQLTAEASRILAGHSLNLADAVHMLLKYIVAEKADLLLVICPKQERQSKTAQSVLHLAGRLKNSETFRSVDPVQLQKAMRDEW